MAKSRGAGAGAAVAKARGSVATLAVRDGQTSEVVTHTELAGLVAIVERLVDRVMVDPPAAAPARETPWCTLPQASERSGLSVGFLARLVREKKLHAVRGGKWGAWVVRRSDVDALEL